MDRSAIETIEGAYVYNLDRHHDSRGYFQEIHRQNNPFYEEQWRQTSLSRSGANVVRGMHQSPYPKLVTCLSGEIYDVMVDLRPESPTFLNWYGMWLTRESPQQILIPAGCAHGFYSAAHGSVLLYLQGDVYDKTKDREWHWQSFGITWPLVANVSYPVVISEKDCNAPYFKRD